MKNKFLSKVTEFITYQIEGDVVDVLHDFGTFSEIFVVWTGKKGYVPNEILSIDEGSQNKRATRNLDSIRISGNIYQEVKKTEDVKYTIDTKGLFFFFKISNWSLFTL